MKQQINRVYRLLMIVMLSFTAIVSITACSDDKDEPNPPQPGTTDEMTGQTMTINGQTWNVTDQSYISTYNTTFWSPSSISLNFTKEGSNDWDILTITFEDVFTSDNFNTGEAMNITKSSVARYLDVVNAKSQEVAYRSGSIIYQGYDAATNLVSLKFDKVTFANQDTAEVFVFDGSVKIKYELSGYTDTIAVNNQNLYVSDCTVINNTGNYSMSFELFKWHEGLSKEEFTFYWWEIDGTFDPEKMHTGDIIDVSSSDHVFDEQSYQGVSDKYKHNLSLTSGTITFQGYDSTLGISLLQLNDLTFTSDDNQTFVLNGTIKIKDQNIHNY